jgi:hypothetical protein
MSQIVRFEIMVAAIDRPTNRRRWNGDPMASAEADEALDAGIDALKAALVEHGFEPVRIGYGTLAEDVQA